MTTSGRQTVLEAASKLVLSDRNRDYGEPEDNFLNIATIWNWWFHTRHIEARNQGYVTFTPIDVAHMMVLMKMARLKTNPTHLDSIIDVAGYAATAGDFCVEKAPKMEMEAPATNVQYTDQTGNTVRATVKGKGWIYDPQYWYVDTAADDLVPYNQHALDHPPLRVAAS